MTTNRTHRSLVRRFFLFLAAGGVAVGSSSAASLAAGSPSRGAPAGRLASSAAAADTQLRESDQKKLGKAIGEYFTARVEEEKIDEALEEVKDVLDSLQKRSKGTDPLSMVEDLERAVFYANDYGKKRVKGKGSIDDWAVEHSYFGELPLFVRAPKKYSGRKGNAYPLILSIPAVGQIPREHLLEDWGHPELEDSAIVVTFEMPEDESQWDQLGEPSSPGGLGLVMASFGTLTKSFAVDMDRIFLAGRGAGVPAAMAIAAQYPHCFAGVLGRAGDIAETAPTNFRNTATFFAGGGGNCTAFEKAAEAADMENCTLSPEASDEEIWNWISATERDATPSRITFEPVSLQTNSAYWLQLESFEPGNSSIDAKVDRASNTIELTANGISSVRVLFNDLLVDLDQPVKVVLNGTTHEDLLPRNFQVMLANAFLNGDSGRVFTASHLYNVTETTQ